MTERPAADETAFASLKDLPVLVVEDEAFQRMILVKCLNSLGVQNVLTAIDGADALSQLKNQDTPPLIITDLQMPNIDGVEMLRQLGEKGKSASVILISAIDESVLQAAETVAKSFRFDIVGTIEKPAKRDDMALLLTRFLDETHKAAPALPLTKTELMEDDALLLALDQGYLTPVFQPKVDLKTGAVVGAEALARLRRSDGGVIGPDAFVEHVETDPAIALSFTAAMTERVLRFFSACPAEFRPPKMSINLPVCCLGEEGVFDQLTAASRNHQVPASNVIWEVTEAGAIANFNDVLQVLTRLRLAGFGLAIDDYGTGHSSIQRLASIPFTEVKIDQTFVRGVTESAARQRILRSAVSMVKDLNLTCVAEGAETTAELELLKELGCDQVQGFVISAPLPEDAFTVWLKNRQAGL